MQANKKIGNYLLTKEIGRGSFSVVYFARRADQPKGKNNRYAVKCIAKESLRGNAVLKKLLNTEVSIMSKIKHPNIMKLSDYFETDNNFYLVVSYCNKGDLENYMRKHKISSLGENQALAILAQLRAGFKELRKYKVMHRDLKLSNIFLHNERVIIGDFGLAKTGKEMTGTQLGTPLMMAPELIAGDKGYDSKTDIWALGVLFYQLLTGTVPFFGLSLGEVYADIKEKSGDRLALPEGIKIGRPTLELLRKMLQMDPKRRISWEGMFSCELLDQFGDPGPSSKSLDLDQFDMMFKDRRHSKPMSLQGLPASLTVSPEKIISNPNSRLAVDELLSQLQTEDLAIEYEYRFKHELNKISFLAKTCKRATKALLSDPMKASFLNRAVPILLQKAINHCRKMHDSLLLREDPFNLPKTKVFFTSDRCEPLLDRFTDTLNLLTSFKEKLIHNDDLRALLAASGNLSILREVVDNEELDNLFSLIVKAIHTHFKYQPDNRDKDLLLTSAFIVLSSRFESMFPYWIDQKKFKWENFVVNYDNMSCQKLREIINMSV